MALRKRIAYSPKQERIEAVQNYKEKAACLTFIATQAVWWMALYYPIPGMREFSKEDVQAFQLDYNNNYKEALPDNGILTNCKPLEKHIQVLNDFIDRTGFDFVDFSNRCINPQAKYAMVTDKYKITNYGRFERQMIPANKNGFGMFTQDILKGASDGIREATQIAVFTLKNNFLFEDSTVMDCIDKVLFIINQYGKGKKGEQFNLEFMMRYLFEEFGIDFANFETVDVSEV